MTSLQQEIEDIVNKSEGEWGVWIDSLYEPGPYIWVNPTMPMVEGASTVKLWIILFVLESMITPELKTLDWSDQLMLKGKHKRGGTGVLRYFPTGYRLSLETAVRLMCTQSDNTATNVVLDHIGGQSLINQHFMGWPSRVETGLTDRSDNLFESTLTKPHDIAEAMQRIYSKPHEIADPVWQALGRCHFRWGLRREIEEPVSVLDLWQDKVISALGRVSQRLGWQAGYDQLLKTALRGRCSPLGLNKEGSLDYDGEGFRHDVGIFRVGNQDILIAAFSRGWPELGYSHDHPALRTMGQIGQATYDFYSQS